MASAFESFTSVRAVQARRPDPPGPVVCPGPLPTLAPGHEAPRQMQEPGRPGLPRIAHIAVYDANPDRRRLLAATLYGLGCRPVPLDCASDALDFLSAQLVAARPNVVIWQLGSAPGDQCAPLLDVLRSGALARIGVVVTTACPVQAIEALGDHASMVHVLGTPYSLVELIGAVNAARRDSQNPTAC